MGKHGFLVDRGIVRARKVPPPAPSFVTRVTRQHITMNVHRHRSDATTGQPPVTHVLLVEDNPDDALLVRAWLRAASSSTFDVVHVSSLQDALTAAQRAPFDAVLLDLTLPDGYGLATLCRFHSAMPQLPIVVLSGVQDEAVALEAVRHGAQDYLVKGDDHGPPMARALRYAIERKRAEEELRRARDKLEEHVADRTDALQATNRRLSDEILERRVAERILRRERDFTSAVLDTVDALVVAFDRDGRIFRINRACEQATGYGAEEVNGRMSWEDFVPPDEHDTVRRVFNELTAGGRAAKHETHWLTRRGDRMLIAWSNTVLRDEHGTVEFIIGTGIDITEQRRAEELAQRRQTELAHVARLSTMGQMATEIAHELNQPLFAIASYADACLRIYQRRTQDACDELAQALTEVSRQAARAGQIIERIRRFVRKESPQRVPLDLNKLVKDMAQLVAVEARAHIVKMYLTPAHRQVMVIGDAVLLEQVVVNLVRNAIEAMDSLPADARHLTISTAVRGHSAVLAVADSGPGLTPVQCARVFEPFYTTKSHGMGMGLAISQSIIESHGGELSALPNTEGGTTFRFRLPLMDSRGEGHDHERGRRHGLYSG